MATWVWIILFVGGLLFEAWTIWGDKIPGTTLSVHVWGLRAKPFARAVLVAATAWLVYHFWFENDIASQTAGDDWAIVITAFLATFVRTDAKWGR